MRAEERVVTDAYSPWWGEILARYVWASAEVPAGGMVLDVACGPGNGLAQFGPPGQAYVIGADRSHEALQIAADGGNRGRLVRLDATALPLPDASIDVIASFETVEHVAGDALLVAELARVLRPDGILFLSTPNALVTGAVDRPPANPFHVREYTPSQLRDLLSSAFKEVELYGQRPTGRFGRYAFWSRPRTLNDWRRTIAARLIARLPRPLQEIWVRATGRALFPGPTDFAFTAAGLDDAHVIVARCQGSRTNARRSGSRP